MATNISSRHRLDCRLVGWCSLGKSSDEPGGDTDCKHAVGYRHVWLVLVDTGNVYEEIHQFFPPRHGLSAAGMVGMQLVGTVHSSHIFGVVHGVGRHRDVISAAVLFPRF